MVLDQTGANAWMRWSPTTSPRGALNKSSRSRRGIDGSSPPDKDFASEKYRRGNDNSRLHEEYELEEEISRESKKVRYSDHHRDKNFTDSLERRHYSRERLPRRHETDSDGEERHELSKNSRSSPKGRYRRDSARNSLSRNDPWSGDRTNITEARRSSKWRSNDGKWGRHTEHGNSLSWNGSKWGKEANRKGAPNSSHRNSVGDDLDSNVKTTNSLSCTSSKWVDETNAKHAPGLLRSSATKWVAKKTSNHSTWNSSKWDDRATAKDAPSSSQWRSDIDKWRSNVKTDNSSSWPKWGDEATTEDASKCSTWRTNADRQGSNMKTGNSSSWPKWDDKTTTEDAPNSSSWRTNADIKGSIMKTDSSLSWPNWDDKTNTEDVPNSSRWRTNVGREGSNMKTDNSSSWPKWDDKTNTKDAPNSSRCRTNAGREDSAMKTDNCSSWSKWDDKTTTKDAPNFSRRRTNADKKGSNVKAKHAPGLWRSSATKWDGDAKETNNHSSWNGSKWDDRATAMDVPSSSQWRSDNDKWRSNVKTDNSSSWPKWGDEATTEDASKCSTWRTNANRQGSNMKTGNSSSWPKWDDKTTTEDAPNSSSWRTNADIKGSIMKTDSSSSWPNWDDKTNTEDAPNSSRSRTNVGREGSNMKTDNSSSWQKWDDKTNTKDAPNSSWWRTNVCGEGSNMKTDTCSSWPKWDDKTTTKDSPNSSRWRTKADRKSSNVNADNASSWLKWVNETNTEDAPNSSCWRSVGQGSNVKTLNSSSRPKWEDEPNSEEAPNFSQWRKTADRQHSYMKTDSSSSWPEWGDKTTTMDAPTSSLWRTSADIRGVTDNISTWQDPKQGDQTATTSISSSSGRRLDNGKQANNVETSGSDPKWDENKITRDASDSSRWRSDREKKDFDVKICSSFLLDCPKWGDRTKTKDFPNSSQYRPDGERKQYDVKASRNAPKWDYQTTKNGSNISFRGKSEVAKYHCYEETKNSSSWNGPKRGDETTTKYDNSSRCRSDVDQQDPLLGCNNSIPRNSPMWGDKTSAMVEPYSSGCLSDDYKQGINVEGKKTSRNVIKWSDPKTTEDVPKQSLQSSDDEKRDYNVNTGSCSLFDASKLGDQITTNVVSANFSQQSSGSGKDRGVKTDNGLSQNDLHQGDHTINTGAPKSNDWRSGADTKDYIMETDIIVLLNGSKLADQGSSDASNCSQWKPDNDKWGYDQETDCKISRPVPKNITQEALSGAHQRSSPSHKKNITQEASRKGHEILNISKSPSRNLNEAQNQQMACSISTTGKDAMPQPCGQGKKSEWHSHQVRSCKQQSQLSATLKPFTNEAAAATTTVPFQPTLRSQSTKPITSDSIHIEHPTIVRESQKSPWSLVPFSSMSVQSSDEDVSWISNLEGNLQNEKQGHEELELIRDAVTEATETQNGQSMEKQITSHPNVTDRDTRKVEDTSRDDEKGILLFKFAIVNFVKDILRPIWKEGRLSKDIHKIIVKKVVDKVTGALHGTSIPQNQKDIDLYISYSKKKLTDLVQAYLEIYAKN